MTAREKLLDFLKSNADMLTPQQAARVEALREPQARPGSLRCDGLVGMLRATALKSCDTCEYQEGRHYCLLHTRQLKNMDTVRCKDWSDKHPNAEISHDQNGGA